jgi:hypothetical protein
MLEYIDDGHIYKWDGRQIPSVSNILAPYMDFSKVPKQMLLDKQAWGTSVHLYLQEYDRGILDYDAIEDAVEPDAPDIKAVVMSWDKFIDPYLEKVDTMKIEHQMFSPRLRYAGTADRIVGNAVIEIKTSQPRKAVGVQLAAYANLAIENNLMVRESVDGKVVDPILVSWHVDEHGRNTVKTWDYKSNFNVFMCLITAFNFFKE